MHKKVYDSPERWFRFKEDKDGYIFDVYHVRTNLKVGVADLESATFRPTDSVSLTVSELRDIASTLEVLQPDYQD
jgi:hypothetical protein